MKQRPIFVAVIGYIIGILWGLYFKISIIPFYILIFAIYNLIKKYLQKIKIFFRYRRYLKLILDFKVILILLIFSIISNTIIYIQNFQYKNTYKDGEKVQIAGIVTSPKDEKQYYDLYKVKIENSKYSMYIQVDKNEEELEYGDEIWIKGMYITPSEMRNYKGYDESRYLKTLKIIGKIKVNDIKLINKNQMNIIFRLANEINLKIKSNIDKTLNQKQASILKGILLGDKKDIDEEITDRYQILNISHVLAISGMHIGYIIIGVKLLLGTVLGRRKTNLFTIMILVLYMFITNFSPSIVRATIMGILIISAEIFHRKDDILNSISISLFLTLMYNPFLILNIGLQLSYLGVFSIILFNSTILKILNSIKFRKVKGLTDKTESNKENKMISAIKRTLSVTISAQVLILPILVINFHMIGVYSLISNLFVSIIIGPIIIVSFIFIILSFINSSVSQLFSVLVKLGIEILKFLSEFSQLPFSKIYVARPSSISIVLYLITVILFLFVSKIYYSNNINSTYKRIKNLIELAKYKINQKRKKYINCVLISVAIFVILQLIPSDLKIYFVDVGQGDSTFIVTPKNKTILIDGGGNITGDFDVGKKVLMPYLLNRGYTTIDYVIVSHFDFDHVRRVIYNFKRIECKKCNYR